MKSVVSYLVASVDLGEQYRHFLVLWPLDGLPEDRVHLDDLIADPPSVQVGSHFAAERTGPVLKQHQLQVAAVSVVRHLEIEQEQLRASGVSDLPEINNSFYLLVWEIKSMERENDSLLPRLVKSQ